MAESLFSIKPKTQFNWPFFASFLARRCITHCETLALGRFSKWVSLDGHRYLLSFAYCDRAGIRVSCDKHLTPALMARTKTRVVRMLDSAADTQTIDAYLKQQAGEALPTASLRIPGCFSIYEAVVRAILAQQVSVPRATQLISLFASHFAENSGQVAFPEKEQALTKIERVSALLPITRNQKSALIELTYLLNQHVDFVQNSAAILKIKGVGPWTMNLIRLRGLADQNVWLAGDLIIKKTCQLLAMPATTEEKYYARFSPWGSYLTLALWHHYNLENCVYAHE